MYLYVQHDEAPSNVQQGKHIHINIAYNTCTQGSVLEQPEENIKKAIVRHIKPDISKIESFMQYKTRSSKPSINNKQMYEIIHTKVIKLVKKLLSMIIAYIIKI